MSREIKFRAWDSEEKIMFEKVYLTPIYCEIYDFHNGKMIPPEVEHRIGLDREDLYVMQFTGAFDKNDKEIYEGDICKIHYYHEKDPPNVIGIVRWIESSSGFSICAVINEDKEALTGMYSVYFQSGGDFGDRPAVEIIGNIYEHKNLLNE